MSGSSSAILAPWILVLAAALLFAAASAQAALGQIDRARLRQLVESGTPRVARLSRLLEQRSGTFTTILFVNTLALGAATLASYWIDAAIWQTDPVLAVVLAVLELLVLMTLQFVARLLAQRRAEQVALALTPPVSVLARLLAPLVNLLDLLGHVVLSALRLPGPQETVDTEERLRNLVEANTDLEEDEREMIVGVIELGVQPVRELMLPRIDIVALPESATVAEAVGAIVRTGHSRVPLYRESIDQVTGFLYAKDVLRFLLEDGEREAPAGPLARPPIFVPMTKKVDELLHEMQTQRFHLAIVLDEYGGTAGLITIEDLIEEIVGEIQDEYDAAEEAPIQELSPDEALFDGRVSIRDVNDTLDLHIDDEDFDTLGGLLYHELGRLPAVGDEVRVNGALATVVSTVGRRIRRVRVSRSPAAQPPSGAER